MAIPIECQYETYFHCSPFVRLPIGSPFLLCANRFYLPVREHIARQIIANHSSVAMTNRAFGLNDILSGLNNAQGTELSIILLPFDALFSEIIYLPSKVE